MSLCHSAIVFPGCMVDNVFYVVFNDVMPRGRFQLGPTAKKELAQAERLL